MPNTQNSRLGQILVSKGLISAAQLDQAIQLQLRNGLRLGETLIAQGWVSERQVKRALKKQNNLRLAATLVAALLGPFQLASADIQRQQAPAISQSHQQRGLKPLSDSEMSGINAQGFDETLQSLFVSAEAGDGVGTMKQLARLVLPVVDSLQAETSMKDVVYDTEHMASSLNPDGSISLRLPSSIGEMRFDNIRVAGAPQSQSMGSLSLQDIDLSQASLHVSMRP
ncbi:MULTISPECIES: hypothetical protein [Pseudomonas]|jgi:hypothetical protein|uniref:Bacteriophage N4 adsorption protein B n=1 Tax=Pseudomonas citronellolis TaxID=53408 RepID=A0A1A9KIN9_9PSED|nr:MULTISPECIES: hypothetical protein [Pseudomonas]KSW23931.1 hypothetical protein AOX63_09220 [Pseudomonas sp. ADP]ANI17000.1 hypothetical protein A9C11_24800 [Pseudomonas citronellolis]KES22835.1 hypothetical protein FG99_19380 [Pseudomonas sp. AAC]KWR80028.1 hypothetical protein RN02_13295 [Pseudomonas sp. PI1]MBB1606308.1 hypothetical protein [Pseudomonas sp. UMC76]